MVLNLWQSNNLCCPPLTRHRHHHNHHQEEDFHYHLVGSLFKDLFFLSHQLGLWSKHFPHHSLLLRNWNSSILQMVLLTHSRECSLRPRNTNTLVNKQKKNFMFAFTSMGFNKKNLLKWEADLFPLSFVFFSPIFLPSHWVSDILYAVANSC